MTRAKVWNQRMKLLEDEKISRAMRIMNDKLPPVAYEGMEGTGLISADKWVRLYVELRGYFSDTWYNGWYYKGIKSEAVLYCITGPGAFSLVEEMERDNYFFCENDTVEMDDGWMFCTPFESNPYKFLVKIIKDIQKHGYDVILDMDSTFDVFDFVEYKLRNTNSDKQLIQQFIKECPDFIAHIFAMKIKMLDGLIARFSTPIVLRPELKNLKPFWVKTSAQGI